jgi:hypothetical protein
MEEMERLSHLSEGIIELNANPYKSKVLFSSTYRDLDSKQLTSYAKSIGSLKGLLSKRRS